MIVEIVPVTARPPVEKIAPRSGVRSVVPQVGQPAPRAISPVIIPAFSRFSEFLVPFFASTRFFLQRKTMRPIRTPWSIEIAKIGNRGYTTGFYLGDGYTSDGYSYDISKGLAGADFLCEVS